MALTEHAWVRLARTPEIRVAYLGIYMFSSDNKPLGPRILSVSGHPRAILKMPPYAAYRLRKVVVKKVVVKVVL